MEHIALEIFDREGRDSKYAFLSPDTTIHIRRTSQIFGSGDIWSFPFRLNIHANAHIFGSTGNLHGARLHEQIDKRTARLWVLGLPLFLGYIHLDDDVDVDEEGNIDVSLEGGKKTFTEKISSAKANQVPLKDDVMIGMALWRPRKVACTFKLTASATLTNGKTATISGEYPYVYQNTEPYRGLNGTDIALVADGEKEGESVQPYPRMVFPQGVFRVIQPAGGTGSGPTENIDRINTDYPYDAAHPYCNVALCYQKYGYEREQEDGSIRPDYSSEPEAQQGYEYMPAERINSAPNFYVIYWIESLMKHLGIHIEENQMMSVEDLRRLFFVNTKCAYKEPDNLRTGTVDVRYGKYRFDMLANRRLVPEHYGFLNGTSPYSYGRKANVSKTESKFSVLSFDGGSEPQYDTARILPSEIPSISQIRVSVKDISDWGGADALQYESDNGYLHYAFATSECFPDTEISEVIRALESGFGVRFLFSDNFQRVRVVLLRNVFRGKDVQEMTGEIMSATMQENPVRGFRMSYGNTDDTHFYYKGFADLLPHKEELWADNSDTHDYSHWDLAAEYENVIKKVTAFDKTCYVTPRNGNAYIIKVDKDAKRYRDLHPATFECAGFMDAEDGDCTGEDDTIESVDLNFSPAIMNDLNMEEERSGNGGVQRFALFVDEKMRPRRPDLDDGADYNNPSTFYDVYEKLYAKKKNDKGKEAKEYAFGNMMAGDGIVKPGEFAINSDMYASVGSLNVNLVYHIPKLEYADPNHPLSATVVNYPVTWKIRNMEIDGCINEGIRLYLQDNFEPNDDGTSPIETHEWNLTLGIMRGSGSESFVDYTDDPDDDENDAWRIVPGKGATAHPDTCDSYGNPWSQDGDAEGHFSLKPRAEKPNPYFDPKQQENDTTNRRYLKIALPELRGRGLCDRFYKEYSFWVRNARIAVVKMNAGLAELIAFDDAVRVKAGDVCGFMKEMEFDVNIQTGLGLVTMQIMYI